ncbi:MAG: HlyD family secretion protein [Clostridiales bacterium]|nr:HlyD family secretion protein [Clostridiales bacterium]
MKLKFLVLYISLFVMLFILMGCASKYAKEESSDESSFQTSVIYGTVQAENTQDIVIDFTATVKEISITEGDTLNDGDPILVLDISDYEHSIQQKKYELQEYRIALADAARQQVSEKEEINYIENQLELKKGYLENKNSPELLTLYNEISALEEKLAVDKKRYEAGQELLNMGGVSQIELMEYKYTYEDTLASYNNAVLSADNTITSLEQEVLSLESQLHSLEASIKNSESTIKANRETLIVNINSTRDQINNMEEKLNKSYLQNGTIVAPREGTIVSVINCEKGEVLSAESGTVLKLVYNDSLYVQGEVLEDMLSSVRVGDQVDIALAESDGDRAIDGTIIQLSDVAVEKDGDTIVMAKIRVDHGYDYLKTGLSVDIYLKDRNDEPESEEESVAIEEGEEAGE